MGGYGVGGIQCGLHGGSHAERGPFMTTKGQHTPTRISWACSKADTLVCAEIADRAVAMAESIGFNYRKQEALMDVMACHCNGCPLRLSELLAADDANFGHDVFGIRRHIDRETGQLTDCFLPRFSAPVVVKGVRS